MARIEAERHSAMNQTLVAICAIADLESQMELVTPWTEDHPEFKATLTYIQQRDYHCSLDKLQQLVVQWLFELSKANMIVYIVYILISAFATKDSGLMSYSTVKCKSLGISPGE